MHAYINYKRTMMLKSPKIQWIIAGLFASYIRIISLTCRLSITSVPTQTQPYLTGDKAAIFITWHGRLILLPYMVTTRPLHALISNHRDGKLISKVAWFFHIRTLHGSSRKGAVSGLKALIRTARRGESVFITPDGPKGPHMVAKSGAVDTAKITGLPIIPVSFSAKNAKIFNSWDHFMLPLPFTKISIVYGKPLTGETDIKDVEKALTHTQQKAESRV